MKKIFLILSILSFVFAILPLPLAFLVDMTYHWFLFISIPIGGILGIVFIIIWALIKEKQPENKISTD